MNKSERAAFLRHRLAVLHPASLKSQFVVTAQKTKRKTTSKSVYRTHFSFGVAGPERRMGWVGRPDVRPTTGLPVVNVEASATALFRISEIFEEARVNCRPLTQVSVEM